MFEGFESRQITTSGTTINLVKGGDGPPLLLLNGYPQTHVMWHKIAPRLAEDFTVVAADLRGYGDSGKPHGDPQHLNYSKRAMAQDMVEVMQQLGFESFLLVGHDRGARTVHRMCLDHSERVRKAAVLDVIPSQYVFTHTSMQWALGSWHWSFMAQPADLPERMLASVPPEWFMERKLSKPGKGLTPFHPAAFAEYVRCFTPKTIRGSCEDYRATATYDFALDTADLDRRVTCPLLVLWGRDSHTERVFGDVLAIWKERAEDVRGRGLDAGHYVNEEAPEEVLGEFLAFFTD
jgi:haloacetate dehalogenase